MEMEDFLVDLVEAENDSSKAQEFFQGVQQDKYDGIIIDNYEGVQNLAKTMHVFLEMCLQLSSKIVRMSLCMAFGTVSNSIVFQEFLASPQSVLCMLTFHSHTSLTLEEAQHVHDGLARNKGIQILVVEVSSNFNFANVELGKVLLSSLAKRESSLKELRLDLPNGNIGKSLLSQVIEGGKCPQTLDLAAVVDEEIICVLADYISLPICHLTGLNIGYVDVTNIDVLCTALKENQSLTSLSFYDEIHHDLIQRLATGLGSHKFLTTLQIFDSDLTDDFFEDFCSHWRQDSNLESLYISGDRVGPNGAAKLLHAIINHPKMKTLDLSWNRTLDFEGLTVIAKALPYLQLRAINLCNCTLSGCIREVLHDDVRVACDSAGQALLEGIQANTFLQEMDVSRNCFDAALCEKIAYWVALNQKIGTVLSTEQELPISIRCNIFGKLSCSPMRVFSLLQQHPYVLM